MAGETIEVLNPRGSAAPGRGPPRAAARQPSTGCGPASWRTARANAKLLLERLVEGLRERHELGPTALRSKNASAPAPGSVLEAFANEADFVLVGSCD